MASARGIELISFDSATKTFVVKQESVDLLKKLHGPVSVVAVCGRARQGKSTLLNRLVSAMQQQKARPSQGFVVGGTHKPCTKGLWLWGQPIQRTGPDGKKTNVLLLDCEGIDAFDQTMDYSTQIFSLGVLLSSLLVFNQMGGIDESAIDKLSSVCEFAKLIQAKSSPGGPATAAAHELSPSFLWLLRDFQFQLTEDGHQISTRDYMEETLRDMAGTAAGVKNRNQMRASIKALFPDRDCFALVRPCLEESDLVNMDKLPHEQLRPEFRQAFDRLTELIMSKAQPKQYRGQYISGSALAAFAQAYVDVINKGQVPAISSTWQSVMKGENQRALESALAVYERAFATAVANVQQQTPGGSGGAAPELQEQLDAAHASALQTAMEEFDQQALGDASERRGYEAKLKEQAGLRFAVVRQARLAEADRRIVDLLSAAGTKIMQLLHADPVDMDKVDSELASVLQQYDAQASGPSKYKRAAEFMVNTVVRSMGEVTRKAATAAADRAVKLATARKEAAEAQGRASDLSHRVKALESTEGSLKQQLASAQQEAKGLQGEATDKARALVMAEARRDQLQADLNEARQRCERLEQRASAAERQAAEAQGQVGLQRGEAARAASEAAERARELSAARQELESTKQAAEHAAAAAADKAARLAGDVARLQGELLATAAGREGMEAELAQARGEAARQLQAREATIAQLQAEVHELRAAAAQHGQDRERVVQLQQQVHEHEVTIQRLQQERAFLQQQYDTLRRESQTHAGLAPTAPSPPPPSGNAALNNGSAAAAAAAATAAPAAAMITVGAAGQQQGDEAEEMDVDEPNRKRRRVAAARTQPAATPPAAGEGTSGGAGASPAPFSSERRVELRRGATPPADGGAPPAAAAAAAGAAGGAPQVPDNLARMTVAEMKTWLTDHGYEEAVFALNQRKPAPKKQDWSDLVKQKCNAA